MHVDGEENVTKNVIQVACRLWGKCDEKCNGNLPNAPCRLQVGNRTVFK